MPLPASLNYLSPIEIEDLCRLGQKYDGGYIVPMSSVNAATHLLTLGLSYDWTFESDFKSHNSEAKIKTYDHTISKPSVLLRAIKALPEVLIRQGARSFLWWARYYAQYFYILKHHKRRVVTKKIQPNDTTIREIFESVPNKACIFLKIDIEGAEYAIIEDVSKYHDRVSTLVIEFHDTAIERDRFEKAVKTLLESFEIIHIHGNNYGGIAGDGLPEFLEITFLRKDLCPTSPARRHQLPIDLDRPCDPGRPDLPLIFEEASTIQQTHASELLKPTS